MKITKKLLVAAADELDKEWAMDPLIFVDTNSKTTLTKLKELFVSQVNGEFRESDTQISRPTLNISTELGIDVPDVLLNPPEPEAPAKAKETTKAATETPEPEKDNRISQRKSNAAERREFESILIRAGESTKKQIVEKTMGAFPLTAQSTIATEISDGKNEKYNKFAKLIIEKKKILRFAE